MSATPEFYAFAGSTLGAKGTASQLLNESKAVLAQQAVSNLVLFFDSNSGRQVDIDVAAEKSRGQSNKANCVDAVAKSKSAHKKTRGRPRLSIEGHEVKLLPRHWQWLDQQRGGASAALRRLIDENRTERAAEDAIRET